MSASVVDAYHDAYFQRDDQKEGVVLLTSVLPSRLTDVIGLEPNNVIED